MRSSFLKVASIVLLMMTVATPALAAVDHYKPVGPGQEIWGGWYSSCDPVTQQIAVGFGPHATTTRKMLQGDSIPAEGKRDSYNFAVNKQTGCWAEFWIHCIEYTVTKPGR